jgi:hypothetical protein
MTLGENEMSEVIKSPWRVDGSGIRAMVRDAESRIVTVRHRMNSNENEKIMTMIAAAPTMLEALGRLMANNCPYAETPTHAELVTHWQIENSEGNGEAADMLFALAAIAKATGAA